MSCWITDFEESAVGVGVPPSFIRWSAIHTVATVLGRKVFIRNNRGITYPNLYIILLALPAVGKSLVLDLIYPFYTDLEIKVAPQHISKAALIDELADSQYFTVTGGVDTYHHAVIVSSEFIETFPAYDLHLLGTLSSWWDCPRHVRERKRHLKDTIDITNVCCNLISGLQPSVLASTFPPEAWSGGFLSRAIMVYAPEKIEVYLRGEQGLCSQLSPAVRHQLTKRLRSFNALAGEINETPSFVDAYMEWRQGNMLPKPMHPKLSYYNNRREHQLEKLSIISAVSRGTMDLEAIDYQRARTWLEEVEANIDDVFIEMVSGDEMAVMKDFHAFLLARDNETRDTLVRRYLTGRVPSLRIQSFLDHAEKAGFVSIRFTRRGDKFYSAAILDEIDIGEEDVGQGLKQ